AWTYLTADPVAVVTQPSEGEDPFRAARRVLARMQERSVDDRSPAPKPPFLGGLGGYLAYEVGPLLQPRVPPNSDHQWLPQLRFGLHDWVIAWHVRTGEAWLGARAVDGERTVLARRLDDVRSRVAEWAFGRRPSFQEHPDAPSLEFRSNLSRPAY